MRQGAETLNKTTCTGVVRPLQALRIRAHQSGMACAGYLLQVLGQVVLVDWQHFWPRRESAVVAGKLKHGTLHQRRNQVLRWNSNAATLRAAVSSLQALLSARTLRKVRAGAELEV